MCPEGSRVICKALAVQGVCNDSVATIQAALEEPVTMFPCILAGQAKTQMAQTYAVCLTLTACLLSFTCHGY